jgi:Putative Ig domain
MSDRFKPVKCPVPWQGIKLTAIVCSMLAAGMIGSLVAPIRRAEAATTNWWTAPSSNPTSNDELLGVSCVSSKVCTAVGYAVDESGNLATLIEKWNGSVWTTMPSPNPADTSPDVLDAVSCASATRCMAVGQSSSQTLVESWDGKTWSILPSPNPGTSNNLLTGVSCVNAISGSSIRCVAVGSDFQGGFQTLVESWNGITWSVVPSPSIDSASNLMGISCIRFRNCTAVGAATEAGNPLTLIEKWNGNSWSIVPSPNPENGGLLDGVSCVSAVSCFAVGSGNYSPARPTLTEAWNGSSWSIVPSPNVGTATGDTNPLLGVSCSDSANCTAVGEFYDGSENYALLETWNGTEWSIISTTSLGDATQIEGVSCLPSGICTAVGQAFGQTLVETNALAITTTSLPSGAVGTEYSATLSAIGGTQPYTWHVISGSLPAGLTLNQSGMISGTPSANAVSSTITLKVKDSSLSTREKAKATFTINVS